MYALSRLLRPTAIGGILSLLFGITLIIGGLSVPGAAGAADNCGTKVFAVGSPALSCPLGTLTVTKQVVGEGAVPPGGFTITITSDNCRLFGTDADSISLQLLPGESKTTESLYQYSGLLGSEDTEPCLYLLTESAAPGWTTGFLPKANVILPQLPQTPSNLVVTIVNTAATPTPTTSAPASSVAPSPSTSAPALASTGSSNTTPQLLLGGGLCLLGLVLIAGTRPKASHV